jgi:hypothetical protein
LESQRAVECRRGDVARICSSAACERLCCPAARRHWESIPTAISVLSSSSWAHITTCHGRRTSFVTGTSVLSSSSRARIATCHGRRTSIVCRMSQRRGAPARASCSRGREACCGFASSADNQLASFTGDAAVKINRQSKYLAARWRPLRSGAREPSAAQLRSLRPSGPDIRLSPTPDLLLVGQLELDAVPNCIDVDPDHHQQHYYSHYSSAGGCKCGCRCGRGRGCILDATLPDAAAPQQVGQALQASHPAARAE